MTVREFGRTQTGEAVSRISIGGGGLTANVITWGAAVQDLRLEGHASSLVLGFDSFEPYPAHSPYFGVIAGRFANRIRDGRFSIGGTVYQAEKNFLGKHVLHGGTGGVGTRNWSLRDHGADHVTLACTAEDGDMGFPGNLAITCTYRLLETGRLVVELRAQTDKPTLCNLAHHSYFNLDNGGRSDILAHRIQIFADAYLPVDDELIPTGHVVPVDGTDYDFRSLRSIGGANRQPSAYDHNFCIAPARGPMRKAAFLQGASSGVEMEVWTSEPGVQFYDGVNVGRQVPGLEGVVYGPHAGLCLEPQVWPDAPNRSYFPQAQLNPGETYFQETEYRFRRGS